MQSCLRVSRSTCSCCYRCVFCWHACSFHPRVPVASRTANVCVFVVQLLEDEPVGIHDFYVRYHTVQLLTLLLQVWFGGQDKCIRSMTRSDCCLCANYAQLVAVLVHLQTCAYKLQAAILASPMGVVRLMDMLSEGEVCWFALT
jgi:hypothetical protein